LGLWIVGGEKLIGAESINKLAEQINRRADGPAGPFILFLGKGCASAAKVPDIAHIAREVLRDSSLPTKQYVKGRDRRKTKDVLQAFYEYLADLSNRERVSLLQRFYAKVAVPLFYQDLVRLIEAGYFLHILTTNIDTLLEQALNGAGLRPDRDYEVISLGARKLQHHQPEPDGPRVTVVKLHGDIAQQQAAITPDEIAEVFQRHSRLVEAELSGDMVMVGYQLESDPVNWWLRSTYGEPAAEPPTLWWVDEERPGVTWLVSPDPKDPPIEYVEGESGKPEVFFGRLLYELEQRGRALLSSKSLQAPLGADQEGHLDAEYLRGQIRRSQQVLSSLEQQVIPGEKDTQIEAQIDYQRRTIAKLEDQLRGLEVSRERLLKLMGQVRDSAREANADPTTVKFLDSQVQMVTEEYRRYTPNQDIVTASTSATVVLAERLGPQVVDQDVVRELATFTPGASARRQL
jgi:phosphoglycolate phosphatase-like HAD superfamily hydrolase